MAKRTRIKDPAEFLPFRADFTKRLAAISDTETLAAILTVTVSTTRGVDTNPGAFLSGAAVISGKTVVQNMIGGLHGVNYKIKVKVQTNTGKELVIVGIVPVRNK